MFSNFIISAFFLVQSGKINQKTPEINHRYFQTLQNYACVSDSIPHPCWKNHYVYLFRPQNLKNKTPVIFFCHGITATNPSTYEALIKHIVSRGYSVIYSPYPSVSSYFFPAHSYHFMYTGFEKGAKVWGKYLDLDSIGLVGHSYGAGAIPSIAGKLIVTRKWGKKSAFLYIMAPWYVHQISRHHLRNFPKHVRMVVEVFENDRINDHRIAKDIYLSMGIPDSAKVFCTLARADTSLSGSCIPDHDVPTGGSDQSLSVDVFDYCGVHLVFDAILSYSLNSKISGLFNVRDTSLQITGPSGKTCRLCLNKKPRMECTQEICVNFWAHSMNPRRKFYKYLGEPLGMVITTPQTALNYGNLALTSLNTKLNNHN